MVILGEVFWEHPNFEESQSLNAFRERGTGRGNGEEGTINRKKVFLQIWDAPQKFC